MSFFYHFSNKQFSSISSFLVIIFSVCLIAYAHKNAIWFRKVFFFSRCLLSRLGFHFNRFDCNFSYALDSDFTHAVAIFEHTIQLVSLINIIKHNIICGNVTHTVHGFIDRASVEGRFLRFFYVSFDLKKKTQTNPWLS